MPTPDDFNDGSFQSDEELIHILCNGASPTEKIKASDQLVEKYHESLMEYAVDLHEGEEFYASDTVSGALIITFKQLFTMDPSDIDDIDFSDLVYSSLNEEFYRRNFNQK